MKLYQELEKASTATIRLVKLVNANTALAVFKDLGHVQAPQPR